MTKRELIEKNRMAILALVSEYGVENIRLFGSVARGEDEFDSDVDFLIKARPDIGAFELFDLIQGLEELLGCRVDLTTDTSEMTPHFKKQIMQEALPV